MADVSIKAIAAAKDLSEGELLSESNLCRLRPSINGIKVNQAENIIGLRLIKGKHKGEFIKESDVERR